MDACKFSRVFEIIINCNQCCGKDIVPFFLKIRREKDKYLHILLQPLVLVTVKRWLSELEKHMD